jgi:energy-coupling factor transporter ATP-binding protein EcfA2
MVGFTGHRIPGFLRRIYKIPEDRFQQNLGEFRELLELGPFLNTPVKALSLGQEMRVNICAAELHDPKLLTLDKPTIGNILLPSSATGALSSTFTKPEASQSYLPPTSFPTSRGCVNKL